MRKSAVAVLLLVLLGKVLGWALANRPVSERPWAGVINGVGLSPYQVDQDPMQGDQPKPEDIAIDLKLLQGSVQGVRTYSSLNNTDLVPAMARKFGLTVTAGAWIQGKPEIDAALKAYAASHVETNDVPLVVEEVEIVRVVPLDVDGNSYVRDPVKNKVYKRTGAYVGRWSPKDERIHTEIPNSDDE